MKSPATVLVHACKLCQTIWEGPVAPPATCPGCGGNAGWAAGEVRPQLGMVGGRIFVPGTDRPRTRVYLCGACSKTYVDRNGADAPAVCPHCGASDAFLEAMTATKSAQPAVTQTQTQTQMGIAVPTELTSGFDATLQRQIAEDRKTEYVAPKAPGSRVRKEEDAPDVASAEAYRREWVADRVANWFDAGMPYVGSIHDLTTDTIWDWAAGIYDSGQKRGFLP